ncbi:hypothetical protein LCGC14_3101570 [marine sediment metagenome]|uniref:Uncharacterized protein n=1 Tax=marine sediment metagenome TaxID=412755 RepID=A0A0F8WWF8_9ZZZZ
MFVQKGVKHMPHMLELPIKGFDSQGRHTHFCEYCEEEALCRDTFYLRHRDLGDVILCRRCCEKREIQLVFRAIPQLLLTGSNITGDHGGVYKYGLEVDKKKAMVEK